jgi:hypothetical protein
MSLIPPEKGGILFNISKMHLAGLAMERQEEKYGNRRTR